MSLGKPVVKDSAMDDDMKEFAISEAMKALDTSNSEKVRLPPKSLFYSFLVVGCIIHEIYFLKKVQICVALHRW